ncbi:MAG: FAD-binding protein [Nitrospirae bacterium]|nr:FAD-binding protein [Nitrospirota bacterium]
MQRLYRLLSEDKVSTSPEDLICYGFDASRIHAMPMAVVWPESAEDVAKVSGFAYENDIPLVPRGAGTSTTGGAVPSRGGIVVSLERMDRIIDVDTDNLTVLVEPGVVNGRLQRELGAMGYFYPPDPASMNFCTIGGNVAENAGGPRALKYGVTGDHVMALEAVLPDGRLIQTGVRTPKGVVGYDLKSLLVGSEGTLSTITKVRLKILPEPEAVITLLASFGDLKASGDVVSRVISSKVIPRTLEFMDREAIQAAEAYNPCGLKDAEALLIIELDGDIKTVQRESQKVVEICTASGADVTVAEDNASRKNLWECRRAVSPALHSIAPTKISEDIVVPRTRIPDMLIYLRRLSEENGIRIVSFGHAGDGNIHVNIMVDEEDGEEYERARALVKKIFSETLRLGGTISGEHGIGLTKAEYIEMEILHPEMDLMRGIKKLFDHKNIMNPGKVFP